MLCTRNIFARRFHFGNEARILARVLQSWDLNPNLFCANHRKDSAPHGFQSWLRQMLVPRPRVCHRQNRVVVQRNFRSVRRGLPFAHPTVLLIHINVAKVGVYR